MTPILPDLSVRSDRANGIKFFQHVTAPSISAFLDAGWEIAECGPSHHHHHAVLMVAPDVADVPLDPLPRSPSWAFPPLTWRGCFTAIASFFSR